jgi:type I restriction enzyme, R subunit
VSIRSVIETLDAIPPTIEGNREMLSWLRGERQWYDEDEKRHCRVTLVDFEHTDANVFHVSWEWTLEPPARKGRRWAEAARTPQQRQTVGSSGARERGPR